MDFSQIALLAPLAENAHMTRPMGADRNVDGAGRFVQDFSATFARSEPRSRGPEPTVDPRDDARRASSNAADRPRSSEHASNDRSRAEDSQADRPRAETMRNEASRADEQTAKPNKTSSDPADASVKAKDDASAPAAQDAENTDTSSETEASATPETLTAARLPQGTEAAMLAAQPTPELTTDPIIGAPELGGESPTIEDAASSVDAQTFAVEGGSVALGDGQMGEDGSATPLGDQIGPEGQPLVTDAAQIDTSQEGIVPETTASVPQEGDAAGNATEGAPQLATSAASTGLVMPNTSAQSEGVDASAKMSEVPLEGRDPATASATVPSSTPQAVQTAATAPATVQPQTADPAEADVDLAEADAGQDTVFTGSSDTETGQDGQRQGPPPAVALAAAQALSVAASDSTLTFTTDTAMGLSEVAGIETARGERLALPSLDPAQLARPETARFVASQLADVVRASKDGDLEITLRPEELGRVRLSFSGEGNTMQVSLTAERPETLDLIKRNIALLEQDLKLLGYDTLNFEFSGEGGGSDRSSDDNDRGRPVAIAVPETLVDPEATPLRTASSGVDIRL